MLVVRAPLHFIVFAFRLNSTRAGLQRNECSTSKGGNNNNDGCDNNSYVNFHSNLLQQYIKRS